MIKDKKFKIGLILKLLIGIVVGIFVGAFCSADICRVVVTLSSLFSSYLKFVIPLMIFSFVTTGISDLSKGAGKLLFATVLISYGSTIAAGGLAYLTFSNIFTYFMNPSDLFKISTTENISLDPYFSLEIPPIMDTISAITLSFILGICLSAYSKKNDSVLYRGVKQFSEFISVVLNKTIIPFLPLYICGTFVDMTYSGRTFVILGILWKVFLLVILLHWIYMIFQFGIASIISKKNFFTMLKHQMVGYSTALGTQSSAATIPVNLLCAEKMGISSRIRNFVIPICANVHMCGSMITITCCSMAVLFINGLPYSFPVIFPFIITLAIAMIASPGAPGGSIMTALPFLPMVGLGSPALQSLMIALYITQDGFGTGCNISGDNAIGVIVDTIFSKYVKKNESLSGEITAK